MRFALIRIYSNSRVEEEERRKPRSQQSPRMEDFNKFEDVFAFNPDVAYKQQTVDDILRHRRTLENVLFIDRLLTTLSIEKTSKLYPPRSASDLRTLHERIVSSNSPDHYKQSVLYYILKDLVHSKKQPTQQPAQSFAKACYLPEKYKMFIDGLWLLDRLKFEKALEYLTEPALIPTFPEDILYALCRDALEHEHNLPLAYFHTVSPCIASKQVLEVFFHVLCRSSITEAFYFSREQGEFTHRHFFEKLIEFVLGNSSGNSQGKRSVELIGLPFDDVENLWFDEYLEEGKGRKLPRANDTIIMRGLTKGDPTFLVDHAQSVNGRKVDGVNWVTFRESLKQSSGLETGSGDEVMS